MHVEELKYSLRLKKKERKKPVANSFQKLQTNKT